MFLERLSVKSGPKRLNFYGQTAVFDHFVRNRHFSDRPFTDKEPIFIDSSVNDSDFAKCSAAHHLLNHCTWPRLRAKRCFLEFARNLRPHCFGEGNRVEHFSEFWRFCSTLRAARAEFEESGRQKSHIFPVFCLLSDPRTPNFDKLVDKNEAFIPFFVYFRIRTAEFGIDGRQKLDISPSFCLLSRPRGPNLESAVDKNQTFLPVFVYFRGRAGRIWSRR